jgi:DNA-binding MarR family transcriptional regulator
MTKRLANLLAAGSELVTDAVAHAMDGRLGAPGSRSSALIALSHDPDEPIETLRRTLGLTHSGAVRTIDRLAADGLVRRERRGRTAVVALTERGREEVQALEGARLEAASAVLAAVPPELHGPLEQALSTLLASHTADAADLRRICRTCSFSACTGEGAACPVAEAATGRGR